MNMLRMVLIALLAQTAPGVPGQPALTGTSSIEGIVLKLGTSEPIAGVDLELTKLDDGQILSVVQTPPAAPIAPTTLPATVPYTAKTGGDGKFVFRNLPSGSFKLVAARIGGLFTPVEYGQKGVLGRGVPFPLGDGQAMKDVKLEMAPVGSISGRVFDENGKGIGHAAVLALSPMYREGQQFLNIMEIVHTDDRGEYRLFSLVPGRYYVTARPEDPTRRTVPLNVVPPGRRGLY